MTLPELRMRDSRRSRLRQALRSDRAYCESLLAKMVECPSPSGSPSRIVSVIERALRECGAETQRFDPQPDSYRPHREFSEPAIYKSGVEGLVGRVSGQHPGIALFSHFDTEPVPPRHVPPRRTSARIYGLGVADAKAGLVSILGAIRAVVTTGAPRPEITVLAVQGKQGGSLGTLPAMKYLDDVSAAVYCHPAETGHGLREIKTASLGVVGFRIHIAADEPDLPEINTPASARPSVRTNPVALGATIVRDLQTWASGEAEAGTSIAVNVFHGGASLQAQPRECVLEGIVTFREGDVTTVLRELRRITASSADDLQWQSPHPPSVTQTWLSANPAATDQKSPIVRQLRLVIAEVTGHEPALYRNHSASDIRFPVLCMKIPTVGIGARAGGFYSDSEWVDRSSLHQTTEVLARLICTWPEQYDHGSPSDSPRA